MKHVFLLAISLALATGAGAQVRLLLESDTDDLAGAEHYNITYNNYFDLVDDTQADAGFSQMNVNPDWGARGLTYGEGAYHMLLESNADEASGQENYLITYNNWSDLMNENQAAATFTQLDVAFSWGVQGMAWDGSQYHLLLESDADGQAGTENYLITYNSLSDLILDNQASATFTQLNVSAGWSVRGFDCETGQFRLLLESDSDEPAGQENYLITYNSLSDLILDNQASATFTDLNVSSGWSAQGLATEGVPEPATVVGLGLGLLLRIRRRRIRK